MINKYNMLYHLLKTVLACFIILDITVGNSLPDSALEPGTGIGGDVHFPHPARPRYFRRITRDTENFTEPNVEEATLPEEEVTNTEIPLQKKPLIQKSTAEEVANTENPLQKEPPIQKSFAEEVAYIENLEFCLWFDNKEKKEHKMHNGTYWPGNGCKMIHCINGEIIPDPSCCKIATRQHGYSINYTLYQNHGERAISACEVKECISGSINTINKIPGCCIHDGFHSIEDGDFWIEPSANTSNHKQCNLGKCNNGLITVKQLVEGEVWGHGCMNYVCEDSHFHVTKIYLPGSCTTRDGTCITNGTTVKLWNECKGIRCFNGKLFKGFLPECSSRDKLLYNLYNA